MIIQDGRKIKLSEKVECRCDECGQCFERTYKNILSARKRRKNQKDYCKKCSCKLALKPQNTKEYWTQEKRSAHSEIMKTSEVFQQSIENRNVSKEHNSMFGKKHSDETKAKMSLARIGKTGPIATAWKGGRMRLSQQVRGILHTRFNWYFLIYKRDGFKCVRCGSKKHLDAHHIIPLSKIINNLLKEHNKDYDLSNLDWLCEQSEIIDITLKNGITLCRECHKQEHNNWGSHNASTNTNIGKQDEKIRE